MTAVRGFLVPIDLARLTHPSQSSDKIRSVAYRPSNQVIRGSGPFRCATIPFGIFDPTRVVGTTEFTRSPNERRRSRQALQRLVPSGIRARPVTIGVRATGRAARFGHPSVDLTPSAPIMAAASRMQARNPGATPPAGEPTASERPTTPGASRLRLDACRIASTDTDDKYGLLNVVPVSHSGLAVPCTTDARKP